MSSASAHREITFSKGPSPFSEAFVSASVRAQLRQRLRTLYTQLLEPVEDKLEGFQRLRVITHPELAGVPWWGLRDSDGFLFEKFALSEVPSTRALGFLEDMRERPGLRRAEESGTWQH